jgi:hypothetical protein
MIILNMLIEWVILVTMHFIFFVLTTLHILVRVILKNASRAEIAFTRQGYRLHATMQSPYLLVLFFMALLKLPIVIAHIVLGHVIQAHTWLSRRLID